MGSLLGCGLRQLGCRGWGAHCGEVSPIHKIFHNIVLPTNAQCKLSIFSPLRPKLRPWETSELTVSGRINRTKGVSPGYSDKCGQRGREVLDAWAGRGALPGPGCVVDSGWRGEAAAWGDTVVTTPGFGDRQSWGHLSVPPHSSCVHLGKLCRFFKLFPTHKTGNFVLYFLL